MLDLDALAAKRAAALKQSTSDWQKAVWDSVFQDLTTKMSDGEVETLISVCSSPAMLNAAALWLRSRETALSPWQDLTLEAQRRGVSLTEFVSSLQ